MYILIYNIFLYKEKKAKDYRHGKSSIEELTHGNMFL